MDERRALSRYPGSVSLGRAILASLQDAESQLPPFRRSMLLCDLRLLYAVPNPNGFTDVYRMARSSVSACLVEQPRFELLWVRSDSEQTRDFFTTMPRPARILGD